MANIVDIIQFEVQRSVRKRSFWLASIAPLILIVAVLSISYLSDHSAKKATDAQAKTIPAGATIGLFDESGLVAKQTLKGHRFVLEKNQQAGIDAVKAGTLNAFLYYPKNVVTAGPTVYEQDNGLTYNSPYDPLADILLKESATAAALKVIHSKQELVLLETSPTVSTVTYKNGMLSNGLAVIIAPGLFLAAFLTIFVLLAYMMIATTTEEKENRAAEILLTSIRARTLILGKIYAIFVLGLIQIVTIAVPLFIGYLKFHDKFSLPGGVSLNQIPIDPTRIGLGMVFFILGLVMYTGILVGLGAMFPSASEAGRFLGTIVIWAYLPIYTIAYILTSPNALIVTVFTYFPLTAPTTVLLRNAVGVLTVGQALPALAILIVCCVLAIMFAVRSFRYGAMEYGRRINLLELFK